MITSQSILQESGLFKKLALGAGALGVGYLGYHHFFGNTPSLQTNLTSGPVKAAVQNNINQLSQTPNIIPSQPHSHGFQMMNRNALGILAAPVNFANGIANIFEPITGKHFDSDFGNTIADRIGLDKPNNSVESFTNKFGNGAAQVLMPSGAIGAGTKFLGTGEKFLSIPKNPTFLQSTGNFFGAMSGPGVTGSTVAKTAGFFGGMEGAGDAYDISKNVASNAYQKISDKLK